MAPSFSSIKKKLSLHSNASSASLESVPSADEHSPVSPNPPVYAKDHALDTTRELPMSSTSTATIHSGRIASQDSAGRATFVLAAPGSGGGVDSVAQPLGSSTADPAHPDIVVDKDGAPVTAIPHTTAQNLQGILSSGERGLGPEGSKTLEHLQAATKIGAGADAVVGEAKGVAPEAVATATIGEKRVTEPWYKRIVKKDRSDSSDGDDADDEQPVSQQAVEALATVAPTQGADVSNIGIQQNETPTVGSSTDREGNPVPMRLETGGAPSISGASTSATSIKDQISSEHSPDPHTTNEKFHQLFPDVPDDDELIEDYRCALQREILIQGRLFASERHLSFRANIFGFETKVCIPWSEITTIEKKMTAVVIPNAIEFATLHARHTFASFIARDSAYDLFVSLWKHAHPEEARMRSDSASSVGGPQDTQSELSFTDDEGNKKKFRFKPHLPSALKLRSMMSRDTDSVDSEQTPAEKVKADAIAGEDSHAPTEYDGEEFKSVAMDVCFPTSPELCYGLMFTDKEFLTKFLVENQGAKELNMGEWADKTRQLSYIKPLNAPMGPKETLVNIKDKNEKSDPETYFTTVTESHTPDVPSGSNFFVMTRTVITWSAGGGARVKVTTEVTWTKVNRMLKGIIERSCLDGQKTYHSDLETAIRAHIAANKSQYAIAGAKEEEAAPAAATSAPSASEGILSYLPSPILTLSILVVILLFSNFFTLVSLRHQARALHAARMGSPEEVASAVQRVLGGFSEEYGRKGRGVQEAATELEGIKILARGLEGQLKQLSDRLEGL